MKQQDIKVYRDKLDWILPFVDDRVVLDLGCVRHEVEETHKDDWLHGKIVDRASRVLGVDYLEDAVADLKQRGFNVICANVETMDIGSRFELIVAGDLIEHLDNFGNFLDRVHAHLDDGGTFLLTTPNPVNLMRFVGILVRGEAGANPEHTCWFTQQVIAQLAERHDLEIQEIAYVDDSAQYYLSGSLFWRPVLWMNSLLARIRPQFAETICVALRAKQPLVD